MTLPRNLAPLLAMAAMAACGPSLVDEPTEFIGNDDAGIAMVCEGVELGQGPDDTYWVKFSVRHATGSMLDWGSASLEADGLSVVRRAVGRRSEKHAGYTQRIETFWLRTHSSGGDWDSASGGDAEVGPYSVRYRAKDSQRWKTLTSDSCPVVVLR